MCAILPASARCAVYVLSFEQVDFVGHLPNPKLTRGAPFGQATAAVSKLRNTRVPMISIKPSPLAAVKQERKKRAGEALLVGCVGWVKESVSAQGEGGTACG
jgi:hypothetical protein